jgi:predicted metal-binding membrane protein
VLDRPFAPSLRAASRAQALAGTATLGLAAACWVLAVRQMDGMDTGVATRLGSFASFLGVWVPMMAAMMLPGALVPALRRAAAAPRLLAVYLAVWTLVGVAAYAAYEPHGSTAAGLIVLAAGGYELTPVKAAFRRHCRDSVRAGAFSLCCVGSSIGLMAVLLALGAMSIAWMAIVAAVVLLQKLVPVTPAIDIPIALAIIGLGVLILAAPASVPGLVPAMPSM